MKPLPALLLAYAALATNGGCTAPTMRASPAEIAHNARASLDWPGPYRGLLPCADCEGIDTSLTLTADGRYLMVSKYLGKSAAPITSEGDIYWSDRGNIITLRDSSVATSYRVGENRITRLAPDGRAITGALAEHYVLTKTEQSVIETYWKLTELNGQPVPILDQEPHMILKAQGGRVTGHAGCNRFMGSYTLDEAHGRISFDPIATTRMTCATGMNTEQAFTAMLAAVDSYTLAGDRLILNHARMAPLARFEAVYLR